MDESEMVGGDKGGEGGREGALDLVIVTENDEPLGHEDFRWPGVLSVYLFEQKQYRCTEPLAQN